ncbi:hypothetical protein HAX54_015719 [Datura stramonium]|uniref:Uncharacterized protein n=1 Tax=Datura stramonium TaxID=4076 RepID=A0ABS8UHK0_DATST|nr:hypothetical protein [Datura stramonium]
MRALLGVRHCLPSAMQGAKQILSLRDGRGDAALERRVGMGDAARVIGHDFQQKLSLNSENGEQNSQTCAVGSAQAKQHKAWRDTQATPKQQQGRHALMLVHPGTRCAANLMLLVHRHTEALALLAPRRIAGV